MVRRHLWSLSRTAFMHPRERPYAAARVREHASSARSPLGPAAWGMPRIIAIPLTATQTLAALAEGGAHAACPQPGDSGAAPAPPRGALLQRLRKFSTGGRAGKSRPPRAACWANSCENPRNFGKIRLHRVNISPQSPWDPATMARHRKPAVIRKREGNPGKRPIPNEIAGRGKPSCPDQPTLASEVVGLGKYDIENLPQRPLKARLIWSVNGFVT